MPLTPGEVATAYRLILERTPSPEETANAAASHDKLGGLRQTLLNSEEFYRKFDAIRDGFAKRLTPVLVHLHIPEAVDPALFERLASAESLQPATALDADSFAALCARPRPERLKLRYLYGDLAAGAGTALRLPHVYLTTIAQPGPRLYRLYRAALAAQTDSKMSFGAYLKYSVDSTPHRLELDNGQMRRLAGPPDSAGFGQEKQLLAAALRNACAPDMIFGFYEHSAALAHRLTDEGLADVTPPAQEPTGAAAPPATQRTAEQEFTSALNTLNKDERAIFEAYTAWDGYFYNVCTALLATEDDSTPS